MVPPDRDRGGGASDVRTHSLHQPHSRFRFGGGKIRSEKSVRDFHSQRAARELLGLCLLSQRGVLPAGSAGSALPEKRDRLRRQRRPDRFFRRHCRTHLRIFLLRSAACENRDETSPADHACPLHCHSVSAVSLRQEHACSGMDRGGVALHRQLRIRMFQLQFFA